MIHPGVPMHSLAQSSYVNKVWVTVDREVPVHSKSSRKWMQGHPNPGLSQIDEATFEFCITMRSVFIWLSSHDKSASTIQKLSWSLFLPTSSWFSLMNKPVIQMSLESEGLISKRSFWISKPSIQIFSSVNPAGRFLISTSLCRIWKC